MTDHKHCPVEDCEGFFEHSEAAQVEIVGGFVEDNDIAAPAECLCEHEARPLAARELVHALVDAGFIE